MQEIRVRSTGREDPLEKQKATHSSILTWEIPWTEELGGYSPNSLKESDTAKQLRTHRKQYYIVAHFYPKQLFVLMN